MVSLYISSTRASVLKLESNSKGIFSLSHFQSVDLVEDAFVNGVLVKPMELSEQLKELLKLEDDLTFILPDSFYFTTRIEGDVVTDEEIIAVGKEQLGLVDEEVIVSFVKLDGHNGGYSFVAIPEEGFLSLKKLFENISTTPTSVVTETMTAFEVFRSSISEKEVVGYLPFSSSLVFYDHLGPISSVALEDKDKIVDEIERYIGEFQKREKKKVKRVMAVPSLAVLLKGLDLEVTPTSFLLENKIGEIAPTGLEGLDVESLNPALLGAFLQDKGEKIDFSTYFKTSEVEKQPLVDVLRENVDEKETEDKEEIDADIKTAAPSRRKFLSFLALSFLAGAVMGIVAIQIFKLPINRNITDSLVTPTPFIAPSPATSPIVRGGVKVKVLNGTTTPKLAKKLADFLKEKGYKDIETGNASKSDALESRLSVKKGKIEMLNQLLGDLKPEVTPKTDFDLDEDNEFDAILILGGDYL